MTKDAEHFCCMRVSSSGSSGGASDSDLSDVGNVGHYSAAEVTALLEDMGVSAKVTANITARGDIDGSRFLDCSTSELSEFLCEEHDSEEQTSDLRILLALQTYIRQTVETEIFFIDNGEW